MLLLISLYTSRYIEFFIITFVLLFHELFHLLFIGLFKQTIRSIEFTAFGGMIKTSLNTSFVGEILIYSGGIIGNIIIFLLFNNAHNRYTDVLKEFNVLMIIINSLPIIPLDGSKVLGVILEKLFGLRKGMKITVVLSVIFLIFFLIYSVCVLSLPFLLMTILLIYHNICFFKSFDDIILSKIISRNIRRN